MRPKAPIDPAGQLVEVQPLPKNSEVFPNFGQTCAPSEFPPGILLKNKSLFCFRAMTPTLISDVGFNVGQSYFKREIDLGIKGSYGAFSKSKAAVRGALPESVVGSNKNKAHKFFVGCGSNSLKIGRRDRIRTCDLLLPKQTRYQAALRADDRKEDQKISTLRGRRSKKA